MSTLESIRQRPVLIISILGVALLLFILTAVDRPQELFSDNHTVVKVDGQKIDYMEYQRRVEEQQEQLRQQGYTNLDAAQVQQYTLQQMVNETLMNQEIERLGLKVTDKELTSALLGETPHPYVAQMLQQMGVPSAQMLYDFAYNPSKNGVDAQQAQQLQSMWKALESDTEKLLLQQKFMSMFTGALTANKLDAQASYEDNASTSTIAYAKADFGQLKDEDFPVSDSEINSLYNQEKNRYRILEPQTVLSYITVDIAPSEADRLAAEKDVEAAVAALKAQEGTEGVAADSKFYVNRVSATAAKLATNLRNNLEKLQADTVSVISTYDNRYTIGKFLGSTTAVDSVLLDIAYLNEGVSADSIVATLNSGVKADSLAAIAQKNDSVWVSMTEPSMTILRDEISQAEAGRFFAPKSAGANPNMAIRVRSKKAPVTVYDIAEITYDVIPSNATVSKLNDDLRKYLAENTNAKAFEENATKAGYSALTAVVTPSSLSVNGLAESRNAAKWAIDAKKDQVSGVFKDDKDSRLMAAAVKDVYTGDFVPASNPEVRAYLTNKIRNQKKAESLVAKFQGKGKTVAEYATVMGVKADTTQVTFGQGYIRNFGMNESALQANVAVAKQGEVRGPIALNNSVVVFDVVSVANQGRAFNYENDAMVFNQREGVQTFQNQLFNVLLGNKKIENRIQKFYSER